MDGHIGPAVEHRSLDLADEHALAPHVPHGHVLAAIPDRLHDHQVRGDGDPSPTGRQGPGNLFGLPHRQRAAPGGYPQALPVAGSWTQPLQVEQLPQRLGKLLSVRCTDPGLQGDGRLVEKLGDDAVSESLHRAPLRIVEAR